MRNAKTDAAFGLGQEGSCTPRPKRARTFATAAGVRGLAPLALCSGGRGIHPEVRRPPSETSGQPATLNPICQPLRPRPRPPGNDEPTIVADLEGAVPRAGIQRPAPLRVERLQVRSHRRRWSCVADQDWRAFPGRPRVAQEFAVARDARDTPNIPRPTTICIIQTHVPQAAEEVDDGASTRT